MQSLGRTRSWALRRGLRAVGGNHEAANHLWELYYGGWAAPNIYYMGAAGVVNFGGLRIGGLSGIFNERDYASGHHEVPPYDRSSIRSAYHVRDLEVYRLLKVCRPSLCQMDAQLCHLAFRIALASPTCIRGVSYKLTSRIHGVMLQLTQL